MSTRVTVGTIVPIGGASRLVPPSPRTTLRLPATGNTGQGNYGEARSCTVPMPMFGELRERGQSADPSSRELQRSTSANLPPSFIQVTPRLGYRTASPIGARSTIGAIRTASPISARSTVHAVVSTTRDDTNMLLAYGGDWEQAKRKLEQDYTILRAQGAVWENAKFKLEQERSKIQATVRRLEAALEQANGKTAGSNPVEASIACIGPPADGNNGFLPSRGSVRRRSPPRGGLRRSTLDQGAPQPCSPRPPHRSESVDVGNSMRVHMPVVRTLSPLQSARMPRAMPEAGSANSAAGAWAPLEVPLLGAGAGSVTLAPRRNWDLTTAGSAQVPVGRPLGGGPPPVPGQSPGLTLRSTTPVMQTRSPSAICRSPRASLRSPVVPSTTIPSPAESNVLPWKPSHSVEAPHGGTRDKTPLRYVSSATCAREELVVHSARAYQVGNQNSESRVYADSNVTSRMGMVSLTSSSASSARTAF